MADPSHPVIQPDDLPYEALEPPLHLRDRLFQDHQGEWTPFSSVKIYVGK